MYSKVALAVAFSPRINAMICEAKRCRDLLDATLILIHIGKETPEKKARLLKLLEEHQINPAKTKVFWEEGKPAKTIIQVCNREDVDLLIAGALKKENLLTYYIGSIARKIIRKANCSVLMLIEPSVQTGHFDKVVINGTEQKQTPFVIRQGLEWCKLEKADQVFILNEIKMYGMQMATAGEDCEEDVGKMRKHLIQNELDYVENILAKIDKGNLNVHIKVTGGRWAVELAKFSEKIHADLLIVGGEKNLTFFDRLFPHDLEDILSNLPCNLLIIKK